MGKCSCQNVLLGVASIVGSCKCFENVIDDVASLEEPKDNKLEAFLQVAPEVLEDLLLFALSVPINSELIIQHSFLLRLYSLIQLNHLTNRVDQVCDEHVVSLDDDSVSLKDHKDVI